MELKTVERTAGKKGETRRLRRAKSIPAVVYNNKGEAASVAIEQPVFAGYLRQIPKGCLATTIFKLEGAVEGKALVKDIQYHPVTYDILHLDFLALHEEVLVHVNVPIRYAGADDSPGVKLGGFLRPVIRSLPVECLPRHLPSEVVLDVSHLNIAESRRLSDISLPEAVTPKGKMHEVAVVVAKR